MSLGKFFGLRSSSIAPEKSFYFLKDKTKAYISYCIYFLY